MTAVAIVLSLEELQRFDPHAPEARGRERRFNCPLPACDGKRNDASHRALAVNTETGAWRCWRCEATGKLTEFWEDRPPESRKARSRRAVRAAFSLSEPDPPPPVPQLVEEREPWREQLRAVVPLAGTPGEAYLQQRGIPLDLAVRAGARYSPNWYGRAAVVFPVRDRQKNLVAAQGRYLHDGTPKVRSCGPVKLGVFSTPDAWEGERLILTEAPIDALTLAAAGYPAIALVGASNCPDWLPQACAFRRVLIALDGDDAGDKAAERLAEKLRPLGAKVERLRPQMFGDWNALAPRLMQGLTAALGEVLGEVQTSIVDVCSTWDEEKAWQQLRAVTRQIGTDLRPDAIRWAEANTPELLVVCDETEAEVNAAFAAEDFGRVTVALAAMLDAHLALDAERAVVEAKEMVLEF